MSTMLWVFGVWLFASLPLGMFIGWMCSLSSPDNDERLISDELPITTAPAADRARFGALGIPA